ncbi:EcsC family protein [Paraconexibacter sp. AEG42_29]
MKTSIEVAEDFLADPRFSNNDARIKSLIRWHVTRSGATGFATGLGGFATMPITLPTGLVAVWVVQARMVGAIAHIRGYDLEDERVRTLAMASLAGDALVTEVMKELGGTIAVKMGAAAVRKVPGQVIFEINKKVGFRLLTKAGTKGSINLTKVVPVLGGVVGGSVDAASTRTVGAVAKRAFPETR